MNDLAVSLSKLQWYMLPGATWPDDSIFEVRSVGKKDHEMSSTTRYISLHDMNGVDCLIRAEIQYSSNQNGCSEQFSVRGGIGHTLEHCEQHNIKPILRLDFDSLHIIVCNNTIRIKYFFEEFVDKARNVDGCIQVEVAFDGYIQLAFKSAGIQVEMIRPDIEDNGYTRCHHEYENASNHLVWDL